MWLPLNKLRRLLYKPNKTILFRRDFQFLTGGHLKLWHYFNHINHSRDYQAQIYLTPNSNPTYNPWQTVPQQHCSHWQPEHADVLFLEGIDWQALANPDNHNPQQPIINLIQGVRHARPEVPLYHFLKYRAIRLCVSQQVADLLAETKQVNGPLLINPNGIDNTQLPKPSPWQHRPYDIVISGRKQPALALQLQQQLQQRYPKHHIKALTDLISPNDFLTTLNHAKITVFLPHFIHTHGEGFFLPALEGMALKTLVICPDCIGNRSFCLPTQNCLQPDYTLTGLLAAVTDALNLSTQDIQQMQQQALNTAKAYSLQRERQYFLQILNNLPQIW